MKQIRGESSDGWRRRKSSAGRASRFSLTLLLKLWAKRNHTKIKWFTELIVGARFWTEPAALTYTETTVWPWETSTATDGMTCMSVSLRDFPTGSIAIEAMERSRM